MDLLCERPDGSLMAAKYRQNRGIVWKASAYEVLDRGNQYSRQFKSESLAQLV
jgi:hypothetical protein